MGRSRYRFIQRDQPHFMTLTVLHWLPVFTRPATVEILLDSLRYLTNEELKIYAWVVLENHVYLLAQSPALDKDMARLKSLTAKKMITWLEERKVTTLLDQLAFYKKAHKKEQGIQFWQEGVHPELIQGQTMMRQKIDYIHGNPVKRGYVDCPEHWRYSSARDYLGKQGLLDICKTW